MSNSSNPRPRRPRAPPRQGRDDFPPGVRLRLAQRAAYRCAMCDGTTVGPSGEASDAVASTGVAAHITAAAPGGRRFDPNHTTDEREAIENAIWLCATHSVLIDTDEVTYTVERLHELKRCHEGKIQHEHSLGDTRSVSADDLAALDSSVRDVVAWPTTLDGEHHLEQAALAREVGCRLSLRGVAKTNRHDRRPSAWIGLTEPMDAVLRRTAQRRPIVLVVDQLDALCDLVDLETERLDAVLALLRKVRGVENLQVVVGCRRFDFEHDARVRGLDAVLSRVL